MKRWTVSAAVLSLCAIVLLATMFLKRRHHETEEASHRRELAYSLALGHYSKALKIGMSRESVESYFRQNGIEFGRICCVDNSDAYADTVFIGKDPPPRWCSGANVYIAFQFEGEGASTDPTDKLHKITIFKLPVDCL
jgi:hypothetical protein